VFVHAQPIVTQNDMAGTVSLRALTSASCHLARTAGALIRQVAGPGQKALDLGLVTKADDTPQTIADRLSQQHIIGGLRSVFSGIAIVGEEDVEEIANDTHQIDLHLLDGCWSDQDDVMCNAEDLSVWIDPLDGTREFTQGFYEFVTTTIGICFKGRPVAGVISEPYACDCVGRIMWGGAPAKGAYLMDVFGKSHGIGEPQPSALGLALVSRSRSAGVVGDALGLLESQGVVHGRLPAGGAGYKAARIVDGSASFWIFPRSGTSRWDTAAAEALLLSVGGSLTDRFGKLIEYNSAADEFENNEGVIASRDAAIMDAIVGVTSAIGGAVDLGATF